MYRTQTFQHFYYPDHHFYCGTSLCAVLWPLLSRGRQLTSIVCYVSGNENLEIFVSSLLDSMGHPTRLSPHNRTNSNNCQLLNVIFIDPCIVIYSYSTTNKMRLLSQIIYSCKTLYMFRTVFPSIIRSSKLRIQQRYMSNSCCYLLLSGMWWNAVSSHPR